MKESRNPMYKTLLKPGTEMVYPEGVCQVVKTDGADRIIATMPNMENGKLPELYGVWDYYFHTEQGIMKARGEMVERYEAENQPRMLIILMQGLYLCNQYHVPRYDAKEGLRVQVAQEQLEYNGRVVTLYPYEAELVLNQEEPLKQDSRVQVTFLQRIINGVVVDSALAPEPNQCRCTISFPHLSVEEQMKILEYILLHGK